MTPVFQPADRLAAGAIGAVSEVFHLNPYNDWLKILFDYGVIGFLVIHAVFFVIFARHRLVF